MTWGTYLIRGREQSKAKGMWLGIKASDEQSIFMQRVDRGYLGRRKLISTLTGSLDTATSVCRLLFAKRGGDSSKPTANN
jgi:hypothetical protein